MDSASARVVFALQCAALPGLAMLAVLCTVATSRGLGDGSDPLQGTESRRLAVHVRVLTNTLEQLVLFVVATVSLAPFLDTESVRIIPTAAVLFFVGRLVYWAGYLKDPQLRGIGLAGTLYPITLLLLEAAYRTSKMVFLG